MFVFQWLFDEAQIDADNVGAPVTKQQWDYIHKMGDALRQSFENVSAVFAPSCVSHAVLTKKDWRHVKIDDISIAEALHCWEQKINRRRMRKLRHIGNLSERLMTRGRKKQLSNLHSENVLSVDIGGPVANNITRVKKKKNRRDKGHKKHKGILFKISFIKYFSRELYLRHLCFYSHIPNYLMSTLTRILITNHLRDENLTKEISNSILLLFS